MCVPLRASRLCVRTCVCVSHVCMCVSSRRADGARDSDGRLLPAPQTLINPMRLQDKLRKGQTGQAAVEARQDVIMEQVGGVALYTRADTDTCLPQ